MYNIFKYIMVKLSSLLIFKLYIDMFLRPLVEVHTPLQEATKKAFFPKKSFYWISLTFIEYA